jgi:hypothetical protein
VPNITPSGMIMMKAPNGSRAYVPQQNVEKALKAGAVVEQEERPVKETIKGHIGEGIRQVKRLGRAAATGVAGIADIPNLAALGLHAGGVKEEPTFYKPLASRTQQAIDELTGGTLKPRSKAEEYADVISEGVAPLALAPLTGGASLTGLGARGIAKVAGEGLLKKGAKKVSSLGTNPYQLTGANVAGSVGTSAAMKSYLDENPEANPLGALGAGLLGGAGARGAYKLRNPLNAAAEGLGRATGFSPKKYAENVELGLPVNPADVSNSNLPKYLEMVAAKMPGSMAPLEKFYKGKETAIARNLGVKYPEDLEHTVRDIPKYLAKKGGKGYHERASKIFKKREEIFKPRETEAITNKELADVSDIIEKLESERDLYLTNSSKHRFDKTPEGILLKELKESIPHEESSNIVNSLKKEGYSDDLIDKILESQNLSPQKKGIGLFELNKLREKALKESEALQKPFGGGTTASKEADVRSQLLASKRHQFMEEIGSPTEIHNAKQARRFWAQYKDERNGTSKYVQKLTGADNDAAAFNLLLRNNPKYLRIARQGTSKEDKIKLTQSIITHMGERQGRFNINTAHTAYSNLEEPIKKEFLRTLPNEATRKNFEGTMKFIGENKKVMEKLANTSNTAHSKHIVDLFKRYGLAIASAATGIAVLPLVQLGTTAGSLYGGAKLWTNQNFLRRMNDVIKAKNAQSQARKGDLLFKTMNQVARQSKEMDNKRGALIITIPGSEKER